MPSVLPVERLKRIAEAEARSIALWKEGISLSADSGKTVDQLVCVVASDRWWLAYAHRRQAKKFMSAISPHYRSAISRYYYSMYHAMRACAFIFHRGDDYEEHSKLPLNIPADFDPAVNWQNKLKNARLSRNKADYEAYPKSERAWQKSAESIKSDAELLLKTARAYLNTKGCNL